MARIQALTLEKPMRAAVAPRPFSLAPDPPRAVDASGISARRPEEAEHHVRHHELSDATAQVAPPARCGVRGAHNGAREHLGAPDLARDEGGEREANQQARGNQGAGALCE
eukprot:scaffold268237_cov28-Tisochrysis_lutea.AAC.4